MKCIYALFLFLIVANSAANGESPKYVEALLSHALNQTHELGKAQSDAGVGELEATYIVYGMSLSASAGVGEVLEASKGLELELHYRKEPRP